MKAFFNSHYHVTRWLLPDNSQGQPCVITTLNPASERSCSLVIRLSFNTRHPSQTVWPVCCLEQDCCPCQWTSDGQCSRSTTTVIHTTKIRITIHKSGKIQSKNVRHLFWCSGSPAFYTSVCCTARLISLPSFQHVFSCPFAPQEVQLSWSHECQQTQCNPLKYQCSTTPNPCMCRTHDDESNSNPEKAVGMVNTEDRGLQSDATTCWTVQSAQSMPRSAIPHHQSVKLWL